MTNHRPCLETSIQYVKGVGPKLAQLFHKKGIDTFEDALYFLPREYQDRRKITPVIGIRPGMVCTATGVVKSAGSVGFGRRRQFEAVIEDKTGCLKLHWFHAHAGLESDFKTGQEILVFGEAQSFRGICQMNHPEYEKVEKGSDGRPVRSAQFGRVIPVYSETEGLHQKTLRRVMADVLRATLTHLSDPLPIEMRERLGLPTLRESFITLHYPDDITDESQHAKALSRVVFEEFFVLQLGLALKKKRSETLKSPQIADGLGFVESMIPLLPFTLTQDQNKCLKEILGGISRGVPMARLVQGDVGAGKTIVALLSAGVAIQQGYQVAMMAPTEVLVQQHYRSAIKLFESRGIGIDILVGSQPKAELRKKILSGQSQLVLGTHALFQSGIEFQNLGLVVVDEQHRFGVDQRNELVRKGSNLVPHLLMMTATPIPRTLALTVYGDLDLSIIREKPAGRKPVKTQVIQEKDRARLYQKIKQQVECGRQVYIIYPLVEASEKLELKSATEMCDKIRREVFPQFRIALLHGRLKAEEKERILNQFKAREVDILVSTTVVEVGIDVPNATLMVIEHPERLGLSQLHQLRGRVGRGSEESFCILVVDGFVLERLRVMLRTEDGFEIAEEDLRLRGPGEFLGTRQSGLPGFRVGHLLRDAELLSMAREEAFRVLEEDPDLKSEAHRGIRQMVETRWKSKIERLIGG